MSYQSLLVLESSNQLVDDVLRYAETHAKKREAYWHHKMLTPVDTGGGTLLTTPARVLHELGVATTLLSASPLSQVARHWAAARYCATLTRGRGRRLALTPDANEVVYHHEMTQSEQLGIGLALVVAKRVLRQMYRGWTFHAVDAEMALKAGFVDGAGAVESVSRTKRRPDYILLGHHATKSRRRMKIAAEVGSPLAEILPPDQRAIMRRHDRDPGEGERLPPASTLPKPRRCRKRAAPVLRSELRRQRGCLARSNARRRHWVDG